MAEKGLRYNRFHVTAMCSPTRAALLTGRTTTRSGSARRRASCGVPGLHGVVPRDCAPFPRVLAENGYSTAAFGKWHLTPDGQQGAAGPFGRWPTGWGFDYFWGFLGGESGQWDPCIAENNKIIGVPEATTARTYYLPDAMAERPSSGCTRSARRIRQAVVHVLLHRLRACAAPCPASGRKVPGQVRPGLGQATRGDLRAAEATRGHPGRTRS